MRHFTPTFPTCPATDDRDYWLMKGDSQVELKRSEQAVWDEIRDYPQWWTVIIRFNSGERTCDDVTLDFITDDDTEQPESPESLRDWYHGRVL